jgi:uncharacterized protein
VLVDRLAAAVIAHQRALMACVLLLTLASAWGAAGLGFDTAIRSWFLEDDPVLVSYAEFQESFGADEIVLVVVSVDGDGPDRLGVFAPAALGVLDHISRGAEAAPHARRVRSVLNAPVARYLDGAVQVGPLLEEVPQNVPVARALRVAAMQSDLLRDSFVTSDGRSALLLVELDPEHTDLDDKVALVSGVQDAVASAPVVQGLTVALSGLPVIDSSVGDMARRDVLQVGPASSFVLILVAFVVFGRLRTALVPLFVVGFAVLWTLGFTRAVGWKFGILGGPLVNVVLAVGVADSVHLLADTLHRMSGGRSAAESLRASLAELLVPCFFTSITTVAGFLAITTSDVIPVREFGVMAAVGALAAFVLTFTFLPVFVGWVRPPSPAFLARQRTGILARTLTRLARHTPGRDRLILALFVVTVGISAWGMTQVHVGANPIGFFRPGTAAREDTLAIEATAGGTGTIEILIDAPDGGLKDPGLLARLDRLQTWLAARPGVTEVRSVLDVLRATHRALKRDAPEAEVLPDTRALAAQLYLVLEGEDDFADFVQDDGSRGRMTVRFNLSELEALIDDVDTIEARLADESTDGLTLSATGYGLLFARLEGYLVNSQVRGMLIAFLAITLMLGLLLRSLPLALFAMIPNLGPVVVGLAIMAALGIPLDPGTLMVGPLALGLVVDDTVHFLVRYRRLRASGQSPGEATSAAIEGTGRALVLTTVLLTASFLTLLAASTAMAMHFGVIAALVAVLALIADLVVLPAALRVARV